jgi:hypothetical protein
MEKFIGTIVLLIALSLMALMAIPDGSKHRMK